MKLAGVMPWPALSRAYRVIYPGRLGAVLHEPVAAPLTVPETDPDTAPLLDKGA